MIYYNEEAERSILGSIIMDNNNITKVMDIVEPKYFAIAFHQELYTHLIKTMSEIEADTITLAEFFKSHDKSDYLKVLMGSLDYIRGVREHAKIVREMWLKREVERINLEAQEMLKTESFTKVLAFMENELSGLHIQDSKRKTQHISEVVDSIKEKRELKIKPKIVSTGFKTLDSKLYGGFYSKQLAIIGARTAVGKTTMLQEMVLKSSKAGKKCLFISLEVDSERVTVKFLSNIASVAGWKIKHDKMNETEFQNLLKAENELKQIGIFIDDSGDLKASDIERVIKNQLEKQPVDLVAVDYVQHIKYENERNTNATMEISKNVVALKSMAQKFDVAMVAAAQINRGGVDKPTLAHFEGSSAIEKNADVAIIIHRDELGEGERKDSYYSTTGILIVAKNRDGKTGEIPFSLDGEFGRFTEVNF